MGDATITESLERALRSIELRARTLDDCWEVCRADEPPSAVGTDYALDGWVKAFSPEAPEALSRRLAWDGWSLGNVRRCLAGQAECRLPVSALWTQILVGGLERRAEVRGELESAGGITEASYFSPDRVPPFFELWVPFVREASHLARKRSGRAVDRLGEAARTDLARQLLVDLVSASVLAVYESFAAARAIRLQAPSYSNATGGRSRRIYRQFTHWMLWDGLPELFEQYPVLARQLCRLVETWVESSCELAERLERERTALQVELDGEQPFGPPEKISMALSDRHRDGRQVRVLKFGDCRRVVYKPRDVGLERAYNDLLAWLREAGLRTVPRPLRVLEGEGYGWMEHVRQRPATSRDEVREYFRSAGGLLCLAWVLQGDDLHADNIIAAPGGPFLVDGETLVQPQRAPGASERPLETSWRRSQLLGVELRDAAGRPFAGGGLEARGGQLEEEGRRSWRACGTDATSFELRDCLAAPKRNVLYLDGEVQEPRRYAEELSEGFDRTYRFLISNRTRLLDGEGPLARFRRCRTRVILRPSELYGRVLFLLRSPAYQRLGLTGSFMVDALNRQFNSLDERPPLWPLTSEERRALQDLDVPYFDLPCDRKAMSAASGEMIEGLFEVSGYGAMVDQAAGLAIDDLEVQLASLRRELEAGGRPVEGAWPDSWLVQEAREIGGSIARRALADPRPGAGGEYAWLKPDQFADRPLSLNLYDGAVGVALYLAALARGTREDALRDLALRAVEPVERWIGSGPTAESIVPQGIGYCFGLGGMVHALVEISVLLDETRLLELAATLASRIDPLTIAADSDFDVAGGSAGAMLGLLRLYQETGSADLVDGAEDCARHLLASRVPVGDGDGVAWASRQGDHLTGLAHGASGIAGALLDLYEVRPDEELLEAARQALRFERRFRAPDATAWRTADPRTDGGRRPAGVAWCTGASGIGLARIAIPEELADSEVEMDLEAALLTLRSAPMAATDNFCCGNGGRIEFLVQAGLERRDSGLLREAHERAAEMIGRKRRSDGFALAGDSKDSSSFDPTLFRGVSGIGYTLLRLSAPGRLSPLTVVGQPRGQKRRTASTILAGGV